MAEQRKARSRRRQWRQFVAMTQRFGDNSVASALSTGLIVKFQLPGSGTAWGWGPRDVAAEHSIVWTCSAALPVAASGTTQTPPVHFDRRLMICRARRQRSIDGR